MTPCALCGCPVTAHFQPYGQCATCPANDPCPGYCAEIEERP